MADENVSSFLKCYLFKDAGFLFGFAVMLFEAEISLGNPIV